LILKIQKIIIFLFLSIDEDPNWDNDPSNPDESEDSAEVRPKKKK
jgi:hypothetical protein